MELMKCERMLESINDDGSSHNPNLSVDSESPLKKLLTFFFYIFDQIKEVNKGGGFS